MNLQKIQDGTVIGRLSGVRDEFAHARQDEVTLPYGWIAAALGVVILIAGLKRLYLYLQWKKVVTGSATGLQLVPEDVLRWWRASDPDARRDPIGILSSASRFAAHLNDLHGLGHASLVRRLHTAWLQSPRGRVAATVMEILTGDRIVVRDQSGTLLAEGLARTASSSEVEMLVSDEGAGWPDSDDRVFIEKGNGFLANAKLRRKRDDHHWQIIVGVEAELGHRREHYRVQARSAVLVFKSSRMMRSVRDVVLGRTKETHHLLAEARRRNPPRYATEFERRGLWTLAASARLEDIGAGGARARVTGKPDTEWKCDEYFLYVSYWLDGRDIELLLPAIPLCDWTECPDDANAYRIRFRFEGLFRGEETQLRTLLARLAAIADHPTESVQNRLEVPPPADAEKEAPVPTP